MKIRFDTQNMSAAVSPLMSTVSTKSTFTSIEGILMETKAPSTLILTSFDLEKGTRIETEVEILEEGSCILNAQKINQTLKVMDGMLTMTVDSKMTVTIESGKAQSKMTALAASDFPTMPRLDSEKAFTVTKKDLRTMLSKVMYAMALNDQRTVLNGCYVHVSEGMLDMVSCDTFKLAKCSMKADVENAGAEGTNVNFSFILPIRTVNELYRMLGDNENEKVRVCVTHKNIIFYFEGMLFFSRVIDGSYIDYERVIIKNHKITTTVDREEFLGALERATLVTDEKIVGAVRSPVKLEFDGDVLKVMANSSAGSTYEEVEIDEVPESILIAFNNRYLIDTLKACTAERVKISMSTPLTTINMEPAEEMEGKEEFFLVVPVRMNTN